MPDETSPGTVTMYNRDDVLAQVQKNGLALKHASAALRADRAVVLAAVAQNGDALQFASDDLRTDREVLRVAAATAMRKRIEAV